jgi:hypothetical protein
MPALAWSQALKQAKDPALKRRAQWASMRDGEVWISGIWLLTNPRKNVWKIYLAECESMKKHILDSLQMVYDLRS